MDFLTELMNRFPEIEANMKLAQTDLLLFLAVIQLIFISMVFIMFIFLTHKIAGPMQKLKNHLEKIRQGGAISPLSFRDGDHFHDVAEEVSLFLETVTFNQENDFQYLDEVAIYIENLVPVVPDDKKPVLSEISRRLMDIKSRYKESL
jgi:methyl-accepting chemotaxis protein